MGINKNKLIEHINDEEQLLILRRVLDKLERVIESHSIECTDFLNPYQRRLCYSFLNRFREISYFEEGGLTNSERKVIIIYPSYLGKEQLDSPISAIRIKGRFKFRKPSHRDYLGALMSLGIKREKIGDILIHKDFGDLITFNELTDYIKSNLKAINKEPVTVIKIGFEELHEIEEEYDERVIVVSSLRLDAIVSALCNISRNSSLSIIKNKKVKVNWQTLDKTNKELSEGDLISIKGFGRVKIVQNIGDTKKGRKKIAVRLFR